MLALSDDTGQSRKNIGYFQRRVNQSNHNKSFVHCGPDSRTFDRCHRAIDSLQCCACRDPFCCQYPCKNRPKRNIIQQDSSEKAVTQRFTRLQSQRIRTDILAFGGRSFRGRRAVARPCDRTDNSFLNTLDNAQQPRRGDSRNYYL